MASFVGHVLALLEVEVLLFESHTLRNLIVVVALREVELLHIHWLAYHVLFAWLPVEVGRGNIWHIPVLHFDDFWSSFSRR